LFSLKIILNKSLLSHYQWC